MWAFFKRRFKPISLQRASLVLALASVLSYVAGLLRDVLITYYFGASQVTDVFYSSFMIPDLIFSLTTAGALSGVFLPMFRDKFIDSEKEAFRFAGSFLLWAMVIILLVSALAFSMMPWLVEFFFAQASLNSQSQIVEFSRIMLLSPILFTLSNFFGSSLMTFKHYLSYAISPFLYNAGIIFTLIVWQNGLGVKSAVYGVVVGLILHAGIRFIDMFFTGFEWKFRLFDKDLWKVAKLTSFKMVSMMSLVLSMLFFSSKAFGMTDGAVTSFNLARNLQSFVVSLFGISLATAAFPFIVDFKKKNELKKLKKCLSDTVLKILIWSLPAMFGMALVGFDMVQVFFERGSFDAAATNLTVLILTVFVVSIPLESVNHLLARIYYASLNTWKPALASFVFLLFNIFGASFVQDFGSPAYLALVFVLAVVLQFMLLLLMLPKDYHVFDTDFLYVFGKMFIASVLMAFAVYSVELLSLHSVLALCLKVVVGAIVYGLLLLYFRIFEYTGINLKKFYG